MEDKPDEAPDSMPSPAGGPRKRPATTIDLTASEVTDTPQQSAETDGEASSVKPRKGWWTHSSAAGPGGAAAAEKNAEKKPVEPDADALRRDDVPSPARTVFTAALSGAAAALVVAGGWVAFESNQRTHESDSIVPAQTLAIDTLNTRLTKLETKPSASRDDDRIQSVVATLGDQVTSLRKEVSSLHAQIEAASANLASLKSSAADNAPSQALTDIEDRLSKLEQGMAALSQSKAAAATRDDAPLRRAVVAATLDQSVSQGAPYAATLAVAAKLDENTETLQPLQLFASTGVPGAAEMSRELLKLLKPLEAEPAPARASASFWDRLKTSVFGLVRITRADSSGTDRAALLLRARIAAQREDVSEARRIVMQLSDQDRALLKEWIDKADAREAALAAARQFAQRSTDALSKSSPGVAQ